MRTWKKALSLALVMLMVVSLLAACGGGDGGSSSTGTPSSSSGSGSGSTSQPATETNADRAQVTIRFSQPSVNLDDTGAIANDPIKAAIEQAVNIKLEYESAIEAYPDKVQTELIAGTGADLFPNYGQQDLTSKWVNDGVVVNIGELINAEPERYPILHMMINSPEFKMYNQMYTGDADKTYAIYALTAMLSWPGPVLYRQDALETAGMDAPPTTTEEFIEYATKVGQSGSAAGWWPRNNKMGLFNEMDSMAIPYGTTMRAPTGDPWTGFMPVGDIEGEWKLMTTSDETKEVVRILADLYKVNGIDRAIGVKDDFAEAKSDFFNGSIGAVGFQFSTVANVNDWFNQYSEANGGANAVDELALGKNLIGPDGKQGVWYSAPYWMGYNWFIPISCEAPDRVLDLMEFLASDEGQDLIFRGIEGQHYTMNGSEVVYDKDAWTEQGTIYNVLDGRTKYIPFAYLFAGSQERLNLEGATNWYQASLNPVVIDSVPESAQKDYIKGVIDSYDLKNDAPAGSLPPYFTIITYPEDMAAKRAKFNEITLQYLPSFITGQKDIDTEWDAYVAAYEAEGSVEFEAAFNAAREKAKTDFEALQG